MAFEFNGLLERNIKQANVFICGVPFEVDPKISRGASKAPNTIRFLSSKEGPINMSGARLSGAKIYDCGNYKYEDINKLTNELQFNFLSNNGFHIILGGDHSISIAGERAFYCKCLKENKIPVIIHLDAHPDLVESDKISLYSNASPVYRALEYGYKDFNVSLLGVRSYLNTELDGLMKHPGVDCFKCLDIKKIGIEKLVDYFAKKYGDKKYLVYISYDIDVNDPSFAPGTGVPEPFGLTNFETLTILCGLVAKLNVDVMDIVEISPPIDVNDITSKLGLKTIYEVISTLLANGKIK